MYAIISELDATSSKTVKNYWSKLRDACGLMAIYELPTPHFTWFAAEMLPTDAVAALIEDLAATTSSISSFVFGFGVFSGQRPVFYLPLVKSQAMIDLHNQIWTRTAPISQNPNRYYAPEFWLPHITLAINDITRESLVCALETVAFESVEMTIFASNLILVSQHEDPSSSALKKYDLGR